MLSERDRIMLEFEAAHPRNTGGKTDLIAHTFGMTRTRYFQALGALMDRADALEAMPLEVHQMRSRRDRRVAARSRRMFTSDAV